MSTQITNKNDFQTIFEQSYPLWPKEYQFEFIAALANLLSVENGLRLFRILASHIRRASDWYISPKLHDIIKSNEIMCSSTGSLLGSCKKTRSQLALPNFDRLLTYCEKFQSSKGNDKNSSSNSNANSKINLNDTILFGLIVNQIFPKLIRDNRWDLIKTLKHCLSTNQNVSEYDKLPQPIIMKILQNLTEPKDLLHFSQVCTRFRKIAGKSEAWDHQLQNASKNLKSLLTLIKAYKKKELTIDPNPYQFYVLTIFIQDYAERLTLHFEEKFIKTVELKELNNLKNIMRQKQKYLKKAESNQKMLHKLLMEELLNCFRTNPVWKKFITRQYQDMFDKQKQKKLDSPRIAKKPETPKVVKKPKNKKPQPILKKKKRTGKSKYNSERLHRRFGSASSTRSDDPTIGMDHGMESMRISN